MTDVTIAASDGGSFAGYLARPAGAGPHPGLVVIQEIFGVNHVMRELCDGLAEQGYVALCPDLFWRQEPGIRITDKTDAEWARAFELYKGFNETKGVEDLIATLDHLRGIEGCSGRVGTIGYCLGGKLAYLMATRSDADCSVAYYGVAIEKNLDEAAAVTRPLLMHLAEKDQYVPPDARARILEAVGKVAAITAHVYPGVDHAFARPGGAHWNGEAAELANRRTADFLSANLKR
ncbi:dienelactone hydrolase family protein [Arenibaculum sp.]|jgi:carboxymethylenebutenolidase|uniref:dienelactone hydrolase family protein n=1 Tax=Arenibaculum sp. TaxID=2865862 RepID=UPI002E110E45|nr:dienelactone hydrolase family protein [Arenibaculum sp.]